MESRTHGPEDDIGRRKHLIRVNSGNVWTAYRQRFDPSQPDARSALEFYAVIAIVAVAAGSRSPNWVTSS